MILLEQSQQPMLGVFAFLVGTPLKCHPQHPLLEWLAKETRKSSRNTARHHGMAGVHRLQEVRKAREARLFDTCCTSDTFVDRNAVRTTSRPGPPTEAFRGPYMAYSWIGTCRSERHGRRKERFPAKHYSYHSIDKSHQPLTVQTCNTPSSDGISGDTSPTNGNHRASSKRQESSYRGKD